MATTSFKSMGLKAEIIQGLAAQGWDQPSQLQQQVIPSIIKGNDTVVQAMNAGTDRSATFAAPALQLVDTNLKATQVLVILPTREQATRCEKFIAGVKGSLQVTTYANVGSVSIRTDMEAVKDGPHIVILTPGRASDLIKQGALEAAKLKMLVFDDAEDNRLGAMRDQVNDILSGVPRGIQIVTLSVTASSIVAEIRKNNMQSAEKISTVQDSGTKTSNHFKLTVDNDEDKIATIGDFAEISAQRVVFCNTKEKATSIARKLDDMGFTTTSLYSDTAEDARAQIAQDFKSGSTLVTSDPLASGIDLKSMNFSIGFELPTDVKTYVCRIGQQGIVLNFIGASDAAKVKEIETMYKVQLKEMPNNVADLIN